MKKCEVTETSGGLSSFNMPTVKGKVQTNTEGKINKKSGSQSVIGINAI
jgi:hypothetical protein